MAKKDLAVEQAEQSVGVSDLANALVQAINLTKPKAKKQPGVDYDPKNPWSPKPGEPRSKLKRKAFFHGMAQGDQWANSTIDLFNQLRPGTYINGIVKITRRRDKGINIDWAFKSPEQRMRVLMAGGFTHIDQILQACITEAKVKAATPETDDF